MKKVQEFCLALANPSKWARTHGIPPYVISRLRHGRVKVITTRYAERLISAADGALSLEDFRHD